MLQRNLKPSEMGTRQCLIIMIMKVNQAINEIRGPRTWNAIPISVRESKSLKSFNKLTKAHLMSLK